MKDEKEKPEGALNEEELEQVSGGTKYFVTTVTHSANSKETSVQYQQSDLDFVKR